MAFHLPVQLPAEQWAALETAYATPVRAYHDMQHVHEVLHHYAAVAAGPGWSRPAEAYLAVLYHDAVYQPGAADNEARSAELAVAHIERWLPDLGIDAARVATLICLTARHGRLSVQDLAADASADDTAHFLDCDMAILGADPLLFDAYDRAIAAEYRGTVPAWLFKLNRRRFLKGLLARERIYLSELFHARFDAQARVNLRRAITEKR